MAPLEIGDRLSAEYSILRISTYRGFSLLELMIVLLIFGILLSQAIPSYRKYTERGYRADATRTVLSIAACQERVRSGNGRYDTRQCLNSIDESHYSFQFESVDDGSGQKFRVLATPLWEERGRECGTLSIDHAGTRDISGSRDNLVACWSGR